MLQPRRWIERRGLIGYRDALHLKSPIYLCKVREVLYDKLKLDVKTDITVTKTAGGLKSTCEATLKKLCSAHPLPGYTPLCVWFSMFSAPTGPQDLSQPVEAKQRLSQQYENIHTLHTIPYTNVLEVSFVYF